MKHCLPLLLALTLFTSCSKPKDDFSIVLLPDTQFYSATMRDGTPEIFEKQTEWIVATRESLNTAFVAHLGDFVQNGDSLESEWVAAEAAISILEDPETTGLPDGIPYSVTIGNHDQWPFYDAAGTTTHYNEKMGLERFSGRSYFGGHFGDNFDNHFELFSASGLDFLVLNLEHDAEPDEDVLDWADGVLKEHSERRAILVTHHLIGTGDPAEFGDQGKATYDALKDNPNLFLMVGGHVYGEGIRVDSYGGNTTYSLLTDYQSEPNGGNGWLRILRFSPESDQITVERYSPMATENDLKLEGRMARSFTLDYDM